MEWRNSIESGMGQRLQLSVRHVAISGSTILHAVNFKNCQANQSCNRYYLLANNPLPLVPPNALVEVALDHLVYVPPLRLKWTSFR